MYLKMPESIPEGFGANQFMNYQSPLTVSHQNATYVPPVLAAMKPTMVTNS